MAKFLDRSKETYSEWTAVDLLASPDEKSDRGSLHDFFAYIFALLAALILALGFMASIIGAGQGAVAGIAGTIGAVAFFNASIASGILAVFCAVMSSRHVRTRKVRFHYRNVFATPETPRL